MVFYHIEERPDKTGIIHCEHLCDVFFTVWEDLRADSFYSRAIGDGVGRRKRYRTVVFQSFRHAGSILRFYTDDLDFRIEHFRQSRDAGHQTATADRHQDVIDSRKFLDDFHSNGPLPCRYVKIIEGMDECEVTFIGKFHGVFIGVIVYVPVEYDLCTVAFRAVHLDQRCSGRHDDGRLASEFFRSICYPLCVVSGRCSNKSVRALLLV